MRGVTLDFLLHLREGVNIYDYEWHKSVRIEFEVKILLPDLYLAKQLAMNSVAITD